MQSPNFYKINQGTKKVVRQARAEVAFQALLVGILAGLLSVIFRLCIVWVSEQVYNSNVSMTFGYKLLYLPLIGAIGGLIAGLLISKICTDGGGSGIPLVKFSLTKLNNKIRLRSVFTKFFAGIAGIGAGLSLGREGPSVHLGAGAGVLVSKIMKNKGFLKNKLIAAGAGAALAATFNSPMAAAIFVFEELLHVFTSAMLFPVLLATVTASTIARYFLGNNFAFVMPKATIPVSQESIFIFILLGIIAGYAGVGFSKYIQLNIKTYKNLKIPDYYKPAVAGLITGFIGAFLPFILGPGNEAVNALLNGELAITTILLILIFKYILTPLCFGSGAAGGLFLPVLMIGSMLGGLTGYISDNLFNIPIEPTVIAIVGMGAFMTAVMRTPITAVVIVFEMTGDYNHILPIMLSAAIAELIADKMHSPSIYDTLIQRFLPPKESLQSVSNPAIEPEEVTVGDRKINT